MQFKGLALVASALVFAACGGAESAPADAAAATTAETAPAAAAVAMAPITGTTHEIKMLGDEKGGFRFEPANLTVAAGDGIKFVFVSGGPHNVAFEATGLTAETKAQLDANFGAQNRMAELMSNMFMSVGEGFTMSFANIAPGAYNYNCTPHIAMGMKGIITVK